MIHRKHPLSLKGQCQLLGISRSSIYYQPRPVSDKDLELMRLIDELHLSKPFMGARMLRDQLNRGGHTVGRRRVARLMKKMGIEALYRRPGTSKKHPCHKVFPYLLRGMRIKRANQVWALDTTYIRMARGFVYLTVVVDWASRKVLAARLAITLETCHAVEVLKEAFIRHGTPEIINTDQGSQFTADEFVQIAMDRGCRLSMDGRGAWRDNIFVERLWRSVKYEEVYLHAYESVREARTAIMNYLSWYNRCRPHSSLQRKTPDEAYISSLPRIGLAV